MHRLAIVTFTVALSLCGTAQKSHANLFGGWVEPFVMMMESFTEPMLEFTGQMTHTMLELSSDIGTMADRIGTMADRIGTMSDRIGTMADRIVATEQLMAETLVTLAQGRPGAVGDGGGGARAGVILLSPRNGERVRRDAPPRFALSDRAPGFVLHASTSPVFAPDERIAVLVESRRELEEAWAQVMMLSGDEVYIAVESVNNLRLSARSNSARLEIID